jgi:hypothetical protein
VDLAVVCAKYRVALVVSMTMPCGNSLYGPVRFASVATRGRSSGAYENATSTGWVR